MGARCSLMLRCSLTMMVKRMACVGTFSAECPGILPSTIPPISTCRRDVEVRRVLASHPAPSASFACACLIDIHRRRYTICGIPLEQDWKAETQVVIATAAGLWFTVARLGDWLQPAEASHKSQVATPGAGGTVTRKAKKLLGKSKVH